MFSFSMLRTYGCFATLGKVLGVIFLLSSPVHAASPIKILALGDSLTQGYGLAEPDGLVPQLQNWFDTRDIAVTWINAGVSGDTTAGGLDRVEWMLDPDIECVMVALGGNDMLRGIDPSATRANLRGILDILVKQSKQIILVGMQAPANYGPEYQSSFDAIFPELAQEFGATYIPSYFVPLQSFPLGSDALRQVMQRDGIHPNERGVAMIVDYLGPILRAALIQQN
jgi:acyl-CoA thioesterase-1